MLTKTFSVPAKYSLLAAMFWESQHVLLQQWNSPTMRLTIVKYYSCRFNNCNQTFKKCKEKYLWHMGKYCKHTITT